MYIAHVAEDGRQEAVKEHLKAVGDKAADFAAEFDSADLARIMGYLHDAGKYSDGFQRRILKNGPKIDHASAGAWKIQQLFRLPHTSAPDVGVLLGYGIAGHHGGLPDGGAVSNPGEGVTLQGRIKKVGQEDDKRWEDRFVREFENDEAFSGTLSVPPFYPDFVTSPFAQSFWSRMMFSCLVDADYLCTEEFMQGASRVVPAAQTLPQLRDHFEGRIQRFYPPLTDLNEARCEILDACKEAARLSPGFFSLTVPTGGGKTFASMRFALQHATQPDSRMRRIIYAIPYTSIIEQNARVFREELGFENVLEHHMNVDFNDGEGDSGDVSDAARVREALRLATENWDVPLVVTTNVQFFESLFACKTSKCRKLHNIANSVIILDEAQMLPVEHLKPCLTALEELVDHYGCTIVLCTATQPALGGMLHDAVSAGLREINPDVNQLFERLKRVTYSFAGAFNNDVLTQRIMQNEQVLCVVNSKAQARDLYKAMTASVLDDEHCEGVYHLSTSMHPEHRSRVIRHINQRLRDGISCRVVSTSLIEAGVDLDFPVVFRAVAGLDSIVQAAGRCNREGRRSPEESIVHIFETSEDYGIPSEIEQRRDIAKSVLRTVVASEREAKEFGVGDPSVIEQYFEFLYGMRRNAMDAKEVHKDLSTCGSSYIPFRAVASRFHLIDDAAETVIIPSGDIEAELDAVRQGVADKETMRRLGRHSVSVYRQSCNKLREKGVIKEVAEGMYELMDMDAYTEGYGLCLDAELGKAVMW